jgi:hypothetical protein
MNQRPLFWVDVVEVVLLVCLVGIVYEELEPLSSNGFQRAQVPCSLLRSEGFLNFFKGISTV